MDTNSIWKYCYWLDKENLAKLQRKMGKMDKHFIRAEKNPCEILLAETGFAEPETWEIICKHDAAPWYNSSNFKGKTLVISSSQLEDQYEPFLETTITPVDFQPSDLPAKQQLETLAKDPAFLTKKPGKWDDFPREMGEQIATGLSKITAKPIEPWDSLFNTWTAVHSNFINPKYRAGEKYLKAPFSISDSYNISSCCVELFNLFDSKEKALLVRPCTGAVMLKAMEKDRYYYVRLVKNN